MTSSAAAGGATLRDVLDAFASGALTVDDIARRTSLDRELVRLAIDQLVALGLISSEQSSTSCPETACGGCSAPTGNGCGTGAAAARGGIVTLTLGRRPAP